MEQDGSTQPWRPEGTYALLGILVGIYILQQLALQVNQVVLYRNGVFDIASWTFVISTDWVWRPWTLITSTVSHAFANPSHLLFNGLFLFFFGPTVERLIGIKRFLWLFFVSGAVAGVAQVELASLYPDPTRPFVAPGALGASGALMALFGILMVIVPKQTIMIWGILPVPMWLAGIGYAALDVLGAFNPASSIGNFAHLAGMAIGLGYAVVLKRQWHRRGLRVVQ